MSEWSFDDGSSALPQAAVNAIFAACVQKYGKNGVCTLTLEELQALIPDAGGISITRVGNQFRISVGDMDEVETSVAKGEAIIVKPGD